MNEGSRKGAEAQRSKAIKPLKFKVVDDMIVNFHCDFAVMPNNGFGSICYCTDKGRAKLITDALNYYYSHPKLCASAPLREEIPEAGN